MNLYYIIPLLVNIDSYITNICKVITYTWQCFRICRKATDEAILWFSLVDMPSGAFSLCLSATTCTFYCGMRFPDVRCWTKLASVKLCFEMSRDMTKPTKWVCAQRRLRSAWASAQSGQSLRCPHEESLSLATHWAYSEDSDQTWWLLGAHSFCWFCHVAAQMTSLKLYHSKRTFWINLSRDMSKPTKWLCAQRRQISLGIRPVWSEPSLCVQWVAKDPTFLHAYPGSDGSVPTWLKNCWLGR